MLCVLISDVGKPVKIRGEEAAGVEARRESCLFCGRGLLVALLPRVSERAVLHFLLPSSEAAHHAETCTAVHPVTSASLSVFLCVKQWNSCML